ncbi:MAG: hypothetical protein L3J67_04850 [Hyphomicrobiaceae bacterium]|nr:hypothetical protein [Hyphomicrobiaceae bacterium]
MFEKLATGEAVKALGLMPEDGFWLAIVLLLLSLLIELALFKSVRDRRVFGKKTVVSATIALAVISLVCAVSGLLLLFF